MTPHTSWVSGSNPIEVPQISQPIVYTHNQEVKLKEDRNIELSHLPITDDKLIKLDAKLESKLESFHKLFSSNVDDLVVENIDDGIVVVGNDPDLVKGIITCTITGRNKTFIFYHSYFWSYVLSLLNLS